MASDSDIRRANIRRFMKARGLQAKPWARSAGVAPATLSNYLNGRTDSMTQRTLEKLAKAAGATVSEMIGEKPVQPRLGRDVVPVLRLHIRAGLGGGIEVSAEREGEPFYFRRSFIDKVAPGHGAQLRVIDTEGDSMVPTVSGGDVVLVDTLQTNPASAPGLYCIASHNDLLVKRVTMVPGARPKWHIQHDNKVYEPYDVDVEEIRIIGRVIWRGGMV